MTVAGVANVNTQYETYHDLWTMSRDVHAGQDTIHQKDKDAWVSSGGGGEYLPQLSGQSEPEYDAYVSRALFYNATRRTTEALVGLLFRTPPRIDLPTALADLEDDATMDGTTLVELANQLAEEIFKTGRQGILVDYPPPQGDEPSVQEAEQRGLRPYLARYKAENILGWQTRRINNKDVISQVRLREVVQERSDLNEFTTETVTRMRVCDLDPAENFTYRQRVYQLTEDVENDEEVGWRLVQDFYPTIAGERLQEIPFVFVGPTETAPEYVVPPQMDLVYANLQHYKVSADYYHGLHFTGLPTVVAVGFDPDDGPYTIGSGEAWVTQNTDAKAQYLEFAGQGLEPAKQELDKLEERMAILGARMLASEKRQVETAEAHEIKRAGENSVLATMANNLSAAITEALDWARRWYNVEDEASLQINTDFLPSAMDANLLQQLFAMHQAGELTTHDFLWNLRRGELIDPTRTDEEIQSEMETAAPALAFGGNNQ